MRAIGPLPADHPPVAAKKIGVLLVNLGTPDAPEKKAVKRYLKEFLSDKRVVEIPSIIWQPILRGIILNTRPAKSAEAYSLVWTEDGSPLASYTRKQAEKLAVKMDGVMVDWAMRYGNPSVKSRLDMMKAAGCDRILIAPLYPQYSGATTASVHDAVFDAIAAMRWQPAIRLLPAYHDDPAYIDQSRARYFGARICPRRDCRKFSRHAAADAGTGRPLSLPLPKNRAIIVRKDGPRTGGGVSVTLWPGEMARTGDRHDAGSARRAGEEEYRDFRAGFLQRLSGNLRGTGDQGQGAVRSRGRREICLSALPQ